MLTAKYFCVVLNSSQKAVFGTSYSSFLPNLGKPIIIVQLVYYICTCTVCDSPSGPQLQEHCAARQPVVNFAIVLASYNNYKPHAQRSQDLRRRNSTMNGALSSETRPVCVCVCVCGGGGGGGGGGLHMNNGGTSVSFIQVNYL